MSELTSSTAFIQPTTSSISARIRKQRKARSLTLQDIERLSAGRIKAVVMGSYERGSRSISLARTIEIANLFGIPLSELIEEPKFQEKARVDELIFDLRRMAEIPLTSSDFEINRVRAFLDGICARRRDWNGEVLSLRNTDLDTLTLLLGLSTIEVKELLEKRQLILKGPNHP